MQFRGLSNLTAFSDQFENCPEGHQLNPSPSCSDLREFFLAGIFSPVFVGLGEQERVAELSGKIYI